MNPRRVAITGIGLVSCLGHDYAEVVRALRAGVSGVRAMPEWERLGLKSRVAGAIVGMDAKLERAPLPKNCFLRCRKHRNTVASHRSTQ